MTVMKQILMYYLGISGRPSGKTLKNIYLNQEWQCPGNGSLKTFSHMNPQNY